MRLRRLGLLCVASVVMATLLPANAFAAFRLRVEDGAGNGFVTTGQTVDGANGTLEKSLGRILVGDHELSPGITNDYTATTTKAADPAVSSIYSQLFLSSIMDGAEDTLLLTDGTTGGTTPTPLPTVVSSGKDWEIFGGESYTWFSDVGPTPDYSLSSATEIDFLGAGQVDFKRNTFAAPEPSALALFGAGLLGIVHIARRRRGLTRHDV